jgi:glutamine phosphoribosylpyrophosphate amidotransferase
MMLVGEVAGKTAILIDDLADTSNTITRAAKLLKKEGASKVYALVTHGVLSGDAIERINASALDRVVVTNSIDQREHKLKCAKLEVLEVGHIFAEVSETCNPFFFSLAHVSRPDMLFLCLYRLSAASTTAKASACSSSMTEGSLLF